MFKKVTRYFVNINKPKIICSGCRHPVGKQYSIGKVVNGCFYSHYFFCSECIEKASVEAFNAANEKGEVPEKYYKTVINHCSKQTIEKYFHILVRSDEGRNILRDEGYFNKKQRLS